MKKLFKKLISFIELFQTKRVFYTIYFNFKYLPYYQAKKMPFMFYKHAYATISNGGKIIISDEMVMSGKKVNWGFSALDYEYQCEKTHLNIAGGL